MCEVSGEVTHKVHPNHTRPGLCPHLGVETHTHTPRAAPSPRCGHTQVQGCALTQVWTHTHTHTHTPRAVPSPGCGHTHTRAGLCLHLGVDTHTLELSCCCLHCHRYPRQKHSFLLHSRAPFILHPSYAPFYSSTYKDTSFPDAFWIGLMVKLRRHHGTHALDSVHSRHGTCPHPYRDRS